MEQNNQVITKVQSTTKQKVILVLAVFGLIGFGLMVAFISNMPTRSIAEKPTNTYIFHGVSLQDVQTQVLNMAQSMNLINADEPTLNQVIASSIVTEGQLNRGLLKCTGCFPSQDGVCGFGACFGGHAKPNDYELRVTVNLPGDGGGIW